MVDVKELLGLTHREVAARKEQGLVNAVKKETSRTYGGIVRANLLNVFNLTVFSMAGMLLILYFIKHDKRTLYDGITISGVALINTIISIIQEIRAKLALDRIMAMSKSTATVIRDGEAVDLPVDEIVQGDLIRLRRGDQIPVDGKMVNSHHCEIDESLLTGESDYIFKEEGDEVRSGSFCVAGQGVMITDKLGQESYINQLTSQVKSYKKFVTPLQQNIDRLVKVLMWTALTLTILVVGAAIIKFQSATGKTNLFIETTRSVASIITSMIPIGLILLSTVAFALGVFRISRKGALVQKLNAIESFANVNVICMDKTGTLTKNQMKLDEVAPLCSMPVEYLKDLVAAFAHLSSEKNATIEAVQKALKPPSAEALDEIPFNSKDKFSAISIKVGGTVRHIFMGALETLGPRLSRRAHQDAKEALDKRLGFRNLIISEMQGVQVSLREDVRQKRHFSLLGLLSLSDEIRPAIKEVLAGFEEKSIALKIVSGDAAETVQAVARASGWTGNTERVYTGPELDKMSPDALAHAARTGTLFARVSPGNKRDLITSIQAQGKYVAMVGDGVNDVLALKKAELGVSMGAGNRMSKDVSDIILLNNDFTILPEVFQEGNTIIGNVQSAAKLFLTKNIYAVLLILFAGFLGLAFPFVPRHVTIIGFFAISIPALLITFSKRVVDIPAAFLKDVLQYTLISGGMIALSALFSYFMTLVVMKESVASARTVMLTQIVLLSLVNFLVIIGGKKLQENLRRNWEFLFFALGFAILYFFVLLLVTQISGLSPIAEFLEVKSLSWASLSMTLFMTLFAGSIMVYFHQQAHKLDPK